MIYKNGLCDPGKNIGVAREFETSAAGSRAIDDYIKMFVASINPHYYSQYTILVCNDSVDFVEADHYVLFGKDDPMGIGTNRGIREIEIHDIARDVVGSFTKVDERRERRAKQSKSNGIGPRRDEVIRERIIAKAEQNAVNPDTLDFDNITATKLSDEEKKELGVPIL